MAYTTTAKVKTYMGVSSSSDDTLIGDLVDAATSFIDAFTHRSFAVSSTSTKKFDAVANVDGRNLLFSDGLEAAAITSVTNGDSTSLSVNTDYVYLPRNSAPYYGLRMLSSSSNSWEYDSNGNPENAISIVANWGYSTSAPDDIKQACIRLSAFLYRQRETNADIDRPLLVEGSVVLPSALPKDVERMLQPYVMGTF